MEPYARAMLQLLYCAAGGAQAEVFTLRHQADPADRRAGPGRPGLALQQAGQAAPDWLGGTRIGAALQEFNDTYGRRGMARGAVVVIISDGWDTGDPAMLAARDGAAVPGGAPDRLGEPAHQERRSTGRWPAAWPRPGRYCDAVVSAHTLHALDDLTTALAHPARRRQVSPSSAPR